MGRGSLLMILGASVVLSVMNLKINNTSSDSMEGMVRYFSKSVARVIGNEGMAYILSELADSATWRVTSPRNLSSSMFTDLGPYSGSYTIKDDSITLGGVTKKVIKLTLDATYNGFTQSVLVYTERYFGFKPVTVRGAFTSNDTINNTISDMEIDGRDHDQNWNVIPGSGVFGISTSAAFVNTKKAEIGGTDVNGKDYIPTSPGDLAIIEQNYNWGGKFPDSPDKALGYTDGYLKSLAQSGIGGSQYVTDPKNLKYPLTGITYVELASGVAWKGAKLGSNPSGIFVVHNSSGNAKIDNATTTGNTPFKGLVIIDNFFHIHMDILGGIILLSPDLEKLKECQGNADKRAFYSSETIKMATSFTTAQGAGWQGRIPIIGWQE